MTEYHFVPLNGFIHWLARGWEYSSDLFDTHHGQWSIIMRRVDG